MPEKLTEATVNMQPLDDDEKQLVQEVYERLELFEQACSPYHQEAKVVREIIRLRDPYQDPPNAKEKTLQLQTLKATFNNCVADQMMAMPEAKLVPETPDKEEMVADLQDLVHHVVYEVNNYDFLRMKSEIIRKNPASLDTPVSKLTAWSITILVFLMKNKNLY